MVLHGRLLYCLRRWRAIMGIVLLRRQGVMYRVLRSWGSWRVRYLMRCSRLWLVVRYPPWIRGFVGWLEVRREMPQRSRRGSDDTTLVLVGAGVLGFSLLALVVVLLLSALGSGTITPPGGDNQIKYYDVVVEVPVKYKARGSWEIEGLSSIKITPSRGITQFFSLGPVCVGPCDVTLEATLGDQKTTVDLGDFSIFGETKRTTLIFRKVPEGSYILLVRVIDDGEVKVERSFTVDVGE